MAELTQLEGNANDSQGYRCVSFEVCLAKVKRALFSSLRIKEKLHGVPEFQANSDISNITSEPASACFSVTACNLESQC